MTPDQERALAVLMARAQEADREAFELLLAELSILVRQFVRRRVGDVAWAGDVEQEILWSVYRGRHTWNPSRPFMPWLYAVAHSRLVDAIRRERRLASREVQDERLVEQAVAQAAATPLGAPGEVREAVSSLPATQRRVLELLKFEERTVKEVAMQLELSPGNVRVIAHRALKALRRLLERQ